MAKLSPTSLNLPAALYSFVGLGAIFFAIVTASVIRNQADAFQERALEEAVLVRTRGAALAFARSLDRDWQHLQSVRSSVPIGDLPSLSRAMTVLAGSGERIAWAGYAGLDGEVLAASGGLLIGQDVSERLWFQQGLRGPFAGDVHDAVLLNRILGGTAEDPLRFLDLAAPITGPDGRVAGVVAFHINSDWAQDYLSEMAESLDVGLLLVNQAGEVVLSSDASLDWTLDLPSLRAAAAGIQAGGFEVWPDGRRYFTTVVPEIAHGTLPSFGWRLVGRIDPAALRLHGGSLEGTIFLTLAGAGVALLLMAAIFARIYLVPVRKLARSAHRIADGHDDYPAEANQTEELALLSAALARIQGQRT